MSKRWTVAVIFVSAAIPVFVTSASNPPKDGWGVSILVASVVGAGIHAITQRFMDAPPNDPPNHHEP